LTISRCIQGKAPSFLKGGTKISAENIVIWESAKNTLYCWSILVSPIRLVLVYSVIISFCTFVSDMVHEYFILCRSVVHQQKTFLPRQNVPIIVDSLDQGRESVTSGGPLRARSEYQASRCISLYNDSFAVSSCSVGLLF